MTMLSPLGKVPKRRPPKRPASRRPQPALIMISVLVIIAIVVWWRVFHPGEDSSAQACAPKPKPGLSTMDPHRVVVRIYNSTDRSGLAKTVGSAFGKRGFKVETMGNDPIKDQRTVEGVGEIRYGSLGAQQAMFVGFQVPGVKLVRDSRTDAVVDVAIGPGYTKLATPAQAKQAAQVAEANAKANEKFDSGSDC